MDHEPGAGASTPEAAVRAAQDDGVVGQGEIDLGDGSTGRVIGPDGATVAEVQLEELDAGWVVSTIEYCG